MNPDYLHTGFFAESCRRTKVHVVSHNKPICGIKIGARMKFQWCSHGINFEYLTCKRCERALIGD